MNRIIPLTAAQAGLVLGEPASIDGQVLLAVGTTLTTGHLAMLANRGVHSLAITVPQEDRAPIETRLVLAMDKVQRPRFARTDLTHPAMKEIYRLALMRRIQQSVLAARSGGTHAG
jgi:hypothetical protein